MRTAMADSMRSLVLAIQFLTRLPTPVIRDYRPSDMARAAAWFPLVGLIIGLPLALLHDTLGRVDPLLAALISLMLWVWITGALHVDGLADLADALGASHADRERFLAVLRDPHLGSFGVVAIVMLLLSKLLLLSRLPMDPSSVYALLLLPAWARLGPLVWTAWLPPLHSGMAQRISERLSPMRLLFWALLLLGLSVWLCLPLALMPLAIAAWGLFLQRRLGGQCGDALGAGIEWLEAFGLLLLVLLPRLLSAAM